MTEQLTLAEQALVQQALARRKLDLYRPYPKQILFHNAGEKYRERLLMAGNQLGKTYCMAAEVAIHATGKYPEWWAGKRFKKAPVIWCAGVTGEVVRDTIQRLLIGDVANPGTGLIPPLDIVETTPSRGVADLVDTILVKHASGSNTRIRLKYYEQGREKFQADTIDFGWEDEEPPEDIHMEFLTRTNATNGILGITFTPLKGMSKVVKRFVREKSPDRIVINMTIDDALHIAPERRQQIISSYKPHEQEARIYGKPQLGSGLIFPILRSDITCDPFDTSSIPFYWQEIAGIDFAGSGEDSHPTAAVRVLYNTQDDIVYVTNVYRRKGGTTMVHAAALKPWGKVPFAWPHDGLTHDKGSAVPIKDQYAAEGLSMLPENARFEDGSNGVEAGLTMMLMRMETGRLKIFSHLTELFEEIDSYYRQDGKIIKEDDDAICACLHPDTLVITDEGNKRIEDLVGTEGRVLTSYGEWADYKNCRMTRVEAELVDVTFSDGHKLLCTPDHLLKSAEGFWVKAIDSMGMECHNAISYRSMIWKILNTVRQYIRSIAQGRTDTMLVGVEDICTGLSMKKILANRPMDGIFTTLMESKPITSFLTYLQCHALNTWRFIIRDTSDTLMRDRMHLMNLRLVKKARNSIVNLVNVITISCGLIESFFVSVVERILQLKIWGVMVFAPMLVSPNGAGMQDWMLSRESVLPAQKYSKSVNITKLKIALEVVLEKIGQILRKEKRTLRVSAVQTVNQKSDVYCMEVPKTFAFALANGAVVHNCRYAIMCLRFARRVNKPRGTINGYPIDEMEVQRPAQEQYNPLGHAYINQILGVK